MPHIGLLVSRPRRTFSRGGFASSGWYMSFDASLARSWTQEVELTTEEGFKDLEGHVGFVDADAREPDYEGHDVGTLSYHQGRHDAYLDGTAPAFLVTLRLPRADLDPLIASVAIGPALRSLNIDVPGLEYGWAPDGSMKKWDNAANPRLPIEGFRLFFGEPEEEEIEPDPVPLIEPGPAFTRHDLEMTRLVTTARYILFAVVALVAVVIFAGRKL